MSGRELRSNKKYSVKKNFSKNIASCKNNSIITLGEAKSSPGIVMTGENEMKDPE